MNFYIKLCNSIEDKYYPLLENNIYFVVKSKFILLNNGRWVDRDDFEINDNFEEEDLKKDDEADRFEAKYNFRY